MKLNENAYVLKKMVRLITNETTGNPTDFSNKLGISRSQLYVEIDELNSLGADIHYDRKQNTFVLRGNIKIIVREPVLVIDDDDLTHIDGGFFQKNCSVLFSGRNELNLAFENSL
ncbi:MAG TPA: hypothetical protein PKH79_12240 [Prolixibacteraceae bacterium]|nr:hypothetical protein [Prolixibacteraceae bacterium]HPS13773.1 hypothetical protein [Prolixibacteraceae bacterium]